MQLGRREKRLVIAAAGAVALLAAVLLLVGPLIRSQRLLETQIASKQKTLADMLALRLKYVQARARGEAARSYLSHRRKGFTLFSFLDNLAGRAGVKQNISYMKPAIKKFKDVPFKTSRVEMKLKAVTLNQLVSYLKLVETAKQSVFVKRLALIRKGKAQKRLDAVMLIETYIL